MVTFCADAYLYDNQFIDIIKKYILDLLMKYFTFLALHIIFIGIIYGVFYITMKYKY